MSITRLKELRETTGISQNELAQTIGVKTAYVWAVESGRNKLTKRETIEAWASALGVDPDEIYHAIGAVPHDLLDILADADPEAWRKVRETLGE